MRFLRANPFLAVGILGVLLFALWLVLGSPQSGAGVVLFWTWRVLAAPLHTAANLLAPLTDSWPDPLDAAAAVFLGLLPWALADVIWRRARRRRHQTPDPDRMPC